LAENNESPAPEPARPLTRSGQRRVARSPKPAATHAVSRAARTTFGSAVAKPMRSVVILSMVAGLIATVALPAYAAWRPEADSLTTQQVAAENAQSLVVASDASDATLTRSSYNATTPEEIDKKKAEEAAAARARSMASPATASRVSIDLNMVAPGSGEVRWPVTDFTYTEINLFRPPSRPSHNGFDMLAPAGTPIYAAVGGVVRVSQNGYGGYGEAVVIDSVLNGQLISIVYGHMTHGTRTVEAGQSVSVGQVIGQVGSTGSSTANHLHFEVTVNGSLIDPLPWLQANAG
jgi:murein DD-endopeptidase MepM/ murein hydrolase activator NlpD